MGRLKRRNFYSNKEWWTRTMWALEATASPSDRMFGYGAATLIELAGSDAASKEEKVLLDAVWRVSGTQMRDTSIRQLLAEHSTVSEPSEEAETQRSECGLGKASSLYREVLAARLKVILDEEFRRETSPLVSELAKIQVSPAL